MPKRKEEESKNYLPRKRRRTEMEKMWPSGEKVTLEILMSQGRVGLLYGRDKHNITTIREMSCAKVRLNWDTDTSKEVLEEDQMTATVSGEPENVCKALELIAMDISDDMNKPSISILVDPDVTGEDDSNMKRVKRFTKAKVEVLMQGKTRKLIRISGTLNELVAGIKAVVELCEVESDDEDDDDEVQREWSLDRV